jgi:hypothetical protein
MLMVEAAQKHFPHMSIMIRTRQRNNYYDVLNTIALRVYREFSNAELHKGAEALGCRIY